MKRLSLTMMAHDHSGHHALSTEVLARARHAKMAGATVLAGRPSQPGAHHGHLLGENSPLRILIVDTEPKITAFVEQLSDLSPSLVLVVEDVRAFRA